MNMFGATEEQIEATRTVNYSPRMSSSNIVSNLVLYLGIASSLIAVGIGYSRIGENTRRIEQLEAYKEGSLTRSETEDFKRRLERIEQKVDDINVRRHKGE